MSEGVVLEPSRLIAGALIGLVILLLLIIKFKVQAMVAILVGAISIGIVAEGRPATVVTTFAALMTPQVPLDVLEKSVLEVRKRGELSLTETAKRLVFPS